MTGFDLLITGGRVIDPAAGLDRPAEIGIRGDRIAAVGLGLPREGAKAVLDAGGDIVCPGLIDLHTHVYEYVTNFGVRADDAGIEAGVTTVVDQGSSGAWTFGGFKHLVAERSVSDVRAFVSINVAGAIKGGMEGEALHNPGMARIDELVALAKAEPGIVRGIKCHGESGSMSHWGTEVLAMAAEAGRQAGLPLYCHTGELFPVNERNRPSPRSVLPEVVPLLKAGDVIAHVYSCMPDGVMGSDNEVPAAVHEALAKGVRFDIGHGVNFSYAIARRMMEAGVLPFSISSDVHADFNSYHDLRQLDYSLFGAINELIGLGLPMADAIRMTTLNPATALGAADEIGTLAVGSRADLTVIGSIAGAWTFKDALGERLTVDRRYLPTAVVRAGRLHRPHCGLLVDVVPDRRLPATLAA